MTIRNIDKHYEVEDPSSEHSGDTQDIGYDPFPLSSFQLAIGSQGLGLQCKRCAM